jgi:hypothetical protein
MNINIIKIEVLHSPTPNGTDHIFLYTDLPGPVDPEQGPLYVTALARAGKGKEYVDKHFPSVPRKLSGYPVESNVGELINKIRYTMLDTVIDTFEFYNLVSESALMLSINDYELSTIIGVSRPSLIRWRKGTSSPHAAMRPCYLELLVRALTTYKENNKD